jgi:hypothetical protein
MLGPLASGILVSLSMLILLLSRGPLCFLLGAANVPGFILWQTGRTQASRQKQRLSILVGWFCQSLASVLVVVLLSLLAKFLFKYLYVSPILKLIYWLFLFYICLAPAYATRKVSSHSATIFDWPYYRLTLTFTMISTAVVFVVLRIVW